MTQQDIIYLRALKVRSLIGILPHERLRKQTLIIGCELGTDIRPAAATDDINKALNYAAVSDFIRDFAEHAEYGLLETFAEALTAALFDAFAARHITLDICKPEALPGTPEVGLRIYRERS